MKKMTERRENDGERMNLEWIGLARKKTRMKNGKAVGPDDIPVEVSKCLGESALELLTKLYKRTTESERMPEEFERQLSDTNFQEQGRRT